MAGLFANIAHVAPSSSDPSGCRRTRNNRLPSSIRASFHECSRFHSLHHVRPRELATSLPSPHISQPLYAISTSILSSIARHTKPYHLVSGFKATHSHPYSLRLRDRCVSPSSTPTSLANQTQGLVIRKPPRGRHLRIGSRHVWSGLVLYTQLYSPAPNISFFSFLVLVSTANSPSSTHSSPHPAPFDHKVPSGFSRSAL